MKAVVDTGVLLDYLNGEPRAARALEACTHRAVSVVTWLEVMSLSPAEWLEPTRNFLRTFERLSVSEAVADEALRLRLESQALEPARALAWATAHIHQRVFLTASRDGIPGGGRNVVIAYAGSP